MKNLKIIILLSILLVGVFCASAQEGWSYDMYETVTNKNFRSNQLFKQTFDEDNPDIPLLNAAIFFATNEQRVKSGISVIAFLPACEIAAYNHSKKMVELKFFSHTNSKESNRKSAKDRLKLAGAKTGSWGENIAYNYASSNSTYLDIADKFLDQWMNSSGHKKNILNTNNEYFGCGVYCSGNKIFGTQVFVRTTNFQEVTAKDKLPKTIKR